MHIIASIAFFTLLAFCIDQLVSDVKSMNDRDADR